MPINTPLPGTYIAGQANSGLRPYGSAGNLFEYENGGLMRQDMLMFNFNTRVTRNVSLQGNYSYNNANCLSGSPSDPYNFSADWGRCGFERQNRFILFGNYPAPAKIRVSPFINIIGRFALQRVSGARPVRQYAHKRAACRGQRPRAGIISTPYGYFDTNPSVTGAFVPMNMLMPGMISVNMRITRTFGFGPARAGNTPCGPGGGGRGLAAAGRRWAAQGGMRMGGGGRTRRLGAARRRNTVST